MDKQGNLFAYSFVMALALVEGDRVIVMKGYGKADPTGRPVTPQTPSSAHSASP
jgi:CubicO group peptidase (beta-lactamase class C family)